jgi:hypothetical protein
MATKKIKRFQEGGLSDKDAGLEASKDDKVGFLERLRMGNIDDPESEAYKRFGAGRGRAARIPVEDRVGTPAEEIRARDTSAPQTISDAMMERGRAEGMRTGSGDASVAEATGPRTKPIEASARPATTSPVAVRSSSSAAPKMQKQPFRRTGGDSSGANKVRSAPAAKAAAPASAPAPRKSAMDMIPTDGYRKVEGGERIDSSELGRNVSNALNAVVPGPARAAKAAQKTFQSADEILSLPSPTRRLGYDMRALPAPTKRLGYDKAGALAKRRADRSAALDVEMKAENAAATSRAAGRKKSEERANELRKGQAKTKFTSKSKAPSKRTKKFDDSETGVEFKRGGSINPASKRADGIATRGKTRCKIC